VSRKEDDDLINACLNFEVTGKNSRGKADMKDKGLKVSDAQNLVAWRAGLLGKKSNPDMHGGGL